MIGIAPLNRFDNNIHKETCNRKNEWLETELRKYFGFSLTEDIDPEIIESINDHHDISVVYNWTMSDMTYALVVDDECISSFKIAFKIGGIDQ